MADADDVPKGTMDALTAAMAARAGRGPAQAPVAAAPVAPAPQPAAPPPPATPPAAPAAAGDQPRGPDGKFTPKPEMSAAEKGLLAAARAERERRKVAEARIAELERRPVTPPPAQPVHDPLPDILGKMPEDTRKWAEGAGKDYIDALIEQRMEQRFGAIEPDLATAREYREQQTAVAQFHADLTEFAEDMALEGSPVDPQALVNTIHRFETEYDISLGSTNRKKFENAIGLMGTQAGKPAGEDPAAAKARLDAEKARGGGASPGSSPAAPAPVASSGDLQHAVRQAALKGDDGAIAKIIGARVPKRPAWAL